MAAAPRIVELDGVRGIACLFVIIHHFFTGNGILGFKLHGVLKVLDGIAAPFFISGVDLFYVLSGFLVGGIIIDHYRDRNFLKVFYLRRTCRIFPVFYALMLSYALALQLLPVKAFPWLLENPFPLWSYFTFLQSYFMGASNLEGPHWVGIAWSVSVEEQFYLLVPFLMLTIGSKGFLHVLFLGLGIAPFLRILFTQKYGFYAGYMFFPGRFDTILWGVLLAYLVRNPAWLAKARAHIDLMLVVAGIGLVIAILRHNDFLHYWYVWNFTLLAMFYSVMMFAVLQNRFPRFNALLRSRFLIFTGMISFGMYMYHQAINGLLHGYVFHDEPHIRGWGSLALTLLAVGLMYGLSYFSFRYFERPFVRFGHRHAYVK